ALQCENEAQMKNPGRKAAGISTSMQVNSVADVDGAIAHAERRLHQPGHVATAIDTPDVAVAEANVVMMVAPAATPAPAGAKGLGGSGGRRQRGGAERGCGNESKSKLTNHGHSPNGAPRAYCLGAG